MEEKKPIGILFYGIAFITLGMLSLLFALYVLVIGCKAHFYELAGILGVIFLMLIIPIVIFTLLGIFVLLKRSYVSVITNLSMAIIVNILFLFLFKGSLNHDSLFFSLITFLFLISALSYFIRPVIRKQFK